MKLTETLSDRKYRVVNISTDGDIRRRILDIGITKGAIIEKLFESPLGEPIAFNIRGSVMALREEITDKIDVLEVDCTDGTDA